VYSSGTREVGVVGKFAIGGRRSEINTRQFRLRLRSRELFSPDCLYDPQLVHFGVNDDKVLESAGQKDRENLVL